MPSNPKRTHSPLLTVAACPDGGTTARATSYVVRSLPTRRASILNHFGPTFCLIISTAPGLETPTSKTDSEESIGVRLRDVRVLIGAGASGVRVQSQGGLTVRHADGSLLARIDADVPTAIRALPSGEVLIGDHGRASSELVFSPSQEIPTRISIQNDQQWSPEREYPGAFRIRSVERGGLDVINHVDVERYVACVVANEIWPTFEREAYRAQAIVARTFVLYQMGRRQGRDIDVTATQDSQVYQGVRDDSTGRRAAEAAEYTRGIVLTCTEDGGRDRLFCTYYSAACGGMSQPAALLGADGDVAPLRGGVACDDCRIAPGDTYRWGPVELSRDVVMSRLASRYPEAGAVGRIEGIEVIDRAPSGRPVRLRIRGTGNEPYDILAERFRLALGGSAIRSTDCRIRVLGDNVIFDEGKGFGHGLGLCQWGMQGRALRGQSAAEILRHYYPGAKLTRAY